MVNSMKRGPNLDNLTRTIVQICRLGLPPTELCERALERLRRAVPFDAAFWATVDPATLLFTDPHQEGIPPATVPYFIQNEFQDDDVNKWTTLASDRAGVRTLVDATAGELDMSSRYRDIFRPLGFSDELRAVLRSGGACWGYLCLHREVGTSFSKDEVLYVRQLAGHLGEGIRVGHLVSSVETSSISHAPGLVVLEPHGAFISMTAAGERWLAELGHRDPQRVGVPLELRALAASMQRMNVAESEFPRLRVRTKAGRWAVLHAARLSGWSTGAIAVIIEEPSPGEIAPILMMAYGLTEQEQTVTGLICSGASTRDIAARLRITPHTVQDHLKSIFDKTGVRSRRELVATILKQQYLPRAKNGRPVRPSG
jgi:DNA-binding CsgD family transcriptional regulator